jgi:hypothetical protein
MSDLGFGTTRLFESLFDSRGALRVLTAATAGKQLQFSPTVKQQKVDIFAAESSRLQEKSVANSGRLRPIIREGNGKRLDKRLSVDDNLVITMRSMNLCSWHYLRADCQKQNNGCKRDHKYPRPLSPEKFDALWIAARQGMCYTLRKEGSCEDERCIYGHGFG